MMRYAIGTCLSLVKTNSKYKPMIQSCFHVQEIGVRLGTNAEGGVQFTVTDTVEEAQEAARALQVSP